MSPISSVPLRGAGMVNALRCSVPGAGGGDNTSDLPQGSHLGYTAT
ncbi:hypothetical protein [Streptomyces purpurascens]|nr:hypothetical protein [Streptomyces purpurascens]MCE7052401.1 hypothetical protein [Streptomyces purpurascens]